MIKINTIIINFCLSLDLSYRWLMFCRLIGSVSDYEVIREIQQKRNFVLQCPVQRPNKDRLKKDTVKFTNMYGSHSC